MFPTIKQLSVRQSYIIGTWINLCQQTRAHRPDSLCGLVQSLCSILPLHTQPHISTVSHSVSVFQEQKTDWKPVCISLCLVLWVGPAPFDHWAAAHPPACFAVSSAKKNSIGFRPPEVISCCLIGLCMCARECLWLCEEAYGLAYYLSVCLYTFMYACLRGKNVNLHACVNNSVKVKTSVCACVYVRLLTVLCVSFGHFNSLLPFNLK